MIKNKDLLIILILSICIIQIAAAPNLCIDAAVTGAMLFFYKVFPSLFPFLVISNLILAYDGIYIYSKIFGRYLCRPMRLPLECGFVLIVSMLCGYPLGAKYSCDIYERHIIDRNSFIRLLNIASNPSPIFVLGAVGTAMLNNSALGYLLLFSCYASSAVIGVLLSDRNIPGKRSEMVKHTVEPVNLGNALKNSVENAINTSISIGGFVIIFSVINAYIMRIAPGSSGIIKTVLIGIIEMTNGCSLISGTEWSILLKLSVISFFLSFSGLSIISQVYSFTYKYNVSMVRYMAVKAVQGAICALITIINYKLFFSFSALATSNIYINKSSWESSLLLSLMLLAMPYAVYKLFKLFKFS